MKLPGILRFECACQVRHLSTWLYFALPNALVGTAIQFPAAAPGRRAIASYVGSVLLSPGYGGMIVLEIFARRQDLAMLLDLVAHRTARPWWSRIMRRRYAHATTPAGSDPPGLASEARLLQIRSVPAAAAAA